MSACSIVISRLTGGRSDKKNYKEKIDSGKHFHNVLCLSEAKGMDINMKVVGIIPARYGSTRLPGKPLKDILGHPMIWWVFQRVKSVNKLDEVYVATDDNRIKIVCEENDIPVVMTANTHRAAAHRLQEVSETIKADFYLQLNSSCNSGFCSSGCRIWYEYYYRNDRSCTSYGCIKYKNGI